MANLLMQKLVPLMGHNSILKPDYFFINSDTIWILFVFKSEFKLLNFYHHNKKYNGNKVCKLEYKDQQGEKPMRSHYIDFIISTTTSQITSLKIIHSTVYSGKDKKKTSQLHFTDPCEGNSLVTMTGEFLAQRASNRENISIWWCHHALVL